VKARVNNADPTKSTPLDAGSETTGGDVKSQTRDDSMINTDSAGQRRHKSAAKRRLASFR